jgi:hypothetical protein
VEQIQADFPHIPLGHFYAAVAYYLANKSVVDADLARDIALYDALSARYPDGIKGPVEYDPDILALLEEHRQAWQ